MTKQRKIEQEILEKWKKQTEDQIRLFSEDESRTRLIFPPLPKSYRLTLHEIAESHQLPSHSFGKEEVVPGRYSVVFKKAVAPSPEEISVIASHMVEGTTQEELEEIILNSKAEAEELKAERERKKAERDARRKSALSGPPSEQLNTAPQKESEAYSRVLQEPNSLFVLNQNKRDRRTIEEIQQAMKQHKKQRREGDPAEEHNLSSESAKAGQQLDE